MGIFRLLSTFIALLLFDVYINARVDEKELTPVDYVNPYIGNISHLLVPTYPTIHLPNSMLRVYPERLDYTSDLLHGLPLVVTSHRGSSAFNLSPYQGESLKPVIDYSYDKENLKPYYYEVTLDDEQNIQVQYAPSHQSAIYKIEFLDTEKPSYLIINSRNGGIKIEGNSISGYQQLDNNTKVFIYLESEHVPEVAGILEKGRLNVNRTDAEGSNSAAVFKFADGISVVNIRYGISFISEEQAKKNMMRELFDYNLQAVKERGREVWNKALSCIKIAGGERGYKQVMYTSLYRTFERPVCISEDGYYFSAFDGKIHEDNGIPFYTDDWIWDTYRAAHPLRLIINEKQEKDIINSYILMAEQMGNMWMPTFPEITGDSRRMNSNHAVATIADAAVKGLDINLAKAYDACKRGIEEKTLAPWSGNPSGWIDDFYKENGYIPALQKNEKEIDPNVHLFEKRQPVAVTLGTSYDQWCLSVIADKLGKKTEAKYYPQIRN